VFHGKERFDQNPDAHHDDHGHGHDAHHTPHESPWVVTAPLLLLAIPSVVIGFLTIDAMLFGDFLKDAIFVNADKHPAMAELAKIFHGPAQMAVHGLMTAPFWLALAGVAAAYYMYMVNPALPAAIKRIFMPVFTLLENKYYMDWFNENVLARGARGLGIGLWKGGDEKVIDGALVNGSWKLVGWVSSIVRKVQTGYIYHYALAMIMGIFILISYFATWPMIKELLSK
ncbi:MAG: NADH-quinone oxidoreductase subunit L, partial [Polaromonas sp.]|nr:NADH-quinone oxidoreductase subunit L [Polaromonas sp.]